MKRDRTSAKVICFTVCYAACQAVAIWILKNLLVLERRMARPQGAGILADLKTCKALDPSCSKFPPYCAYQVCVWSLTTHLIPYPFPFFKRAIQVNGIRKGLPGGYDTMSSSVLMGYSSVFTRLFPVSCLVRWGIVLHFLSKLCLCHQATLLVAH